MSTAIQPIIPTDYETGWKMACIIHKSGLTGKSLDTPEKVFVAMQLGANLGLSPMQAVQNIYVLNGKPVIYGDAQLAVVKASGQLEYIHESLSYDKESGKDAGLTAICKVKRKDEVEVTASFTHADAVKAGLHGKSGPWSHYPKRMMQMRARAFALRDVFPDILLGLGHTVEEMQSDDIRDITPIDLPVKYQFYNHDGELGNEVTVQEAIDDITTILDSIETPEHWKAFQIWKNNNRYVLAALSREHPELLTGISAKSQELQGLYGKN